MTKPTPRLHHILKELLKSSLISDHPEEQQRACNLLLKHGGKTGAELKAEGK